jgi:hypothetical protein
VRCDGGRLGLSACAAFHGGAGEPSESLNPHYGRSGDHRAHFDGCQRVEGPRPPNDPETTLGTPKTTGIGFVNTQRRSKDRQVAKRRTALEATGATNGRCRQAASTSIGCRRRSFDLRCVFRRSIPVVWSRRESSFALFGRSDPKQRTTGILTVRWTRPAPVPSLAGQPRRRPRCERAPALVFRPALRFPEIKTCRLVSARVVVALFGRCRPSTTLR